MLDVNAQVLEAVFQPLELGFEGRVSGLGMVEIEAERGAVAADAIGVAGLCQQAAGVFQGPPSRPLADFVPAVDERVDAG